MKKLASLLGIALAIFMLAPGHAYSRGGGGGGRFNQDNDRPTPTPAPTPVPAPLPVQGTITQVTPFAVSIKSDSQTFTLTYKVSSESKLTLNGKPAAVGELKPGMLATITPNKDNVYADSIEASIPAPVPPPGSTASTAEAPPIIQGTQGGTTAPTSYFGTPESPFGKPDMP